MKSNSFLLFLTIFILLANISMVAGQTTKNKPFIVVLDAGHGGKDSGNLGNGYIEKEIALDVTLQVGKILQNQPGFKVIYTRTTDVFIELKDRGPVANKADADIFVSIHCDSHTSQAYGAGTFVMGIDKTGKNLETAKRENEVIFLEENYEEKYAGFDPNNPASLIGLTLMQEEYLDQSIMLAGLIQNNFTTNLKRKDRSVRSAPFWVLHSSYMPSVLVELGFLTNKSEGAYLNSKKGRREMAEQVAKGIIAYKNNIELTTGDFQNPQITEEEINNAINTTEENNYEGLIFKVQIAASSKKLETIPVNFKGLKDVARETEDNLYKYYYGSSSNFNKIKLMKKFAQEKGFNAAFIVALKGNEKVKLASVLKKEDQ